MRLEVKLAIVGAILLATALLLQAEPRTIEKTVTIPVEDPILDTKLAVDPGHVRYTRFEVPAGAQEPELHVVVEVYEGGNRDIDLVVANAAGQKLYSERITGYAERTIPLPGPGTYKIQFDNSFSLLTTKYLYAKATLLYKKSIIRTETTEGDSAMAPGLASLGATLLIVAGAIALARTVGLSVKAFREGLKGK